MAFKEIEEEILKLSEPEKKEVLRRLIVDLDDKRDEDFERVWLEKAQRRYVELKEGRVQAVPAEESISKARERLRNVRRTSS